LIKIQQTINIFTTWYWKFLADSAIYNC